MCKNKESILPIIIHDSIKSVSNGDHWAISKLGSYGGLDKIVSFQVDRCCRFIQNQDASLSQQCASQADQLPLPNTKNE